MTAVRAHALLGALILLGAEVYAQTPQKKPPPKPAPGRTPAAFKVEIEQDGKLVARQDHDVYLKRAPFAIVVSSPDKRAMWVEVSWDKTTFETARDGKPFGNAFRTGIVGADSPGNPDRLLFVSRPPDRTLHYWDPGSPESPSNFDAVTAMGGGYRGRRTVAKLFAGGHEVELSAAPRRPLHLVLVCGVSEAPDWVVREERREFVRLLFDAVPDSVKTAVRSHFETLSSSDKPLTEREAALQALARMGRDAVLGLDAVSRETRVRANEAAIVADARALLGAENAFAAANRGFFGPLDCLAKPAGCIPKYAGPVLLAEDPTGLRVGYVRRFVPGPAPAAQEVKKAKASASSLRTWALVAVPAEPGESGERGFCADSTGRVCSTEESTEPVVTEGRCPEVCATLP